MARHWNPDLEGGLVRTENWSAAGSSAQLQLVPDAALLTRGPGAGLAPQSAALRALFHVMPYSERRELLALRGLCRQSQPFRACAVVNEDAALLAVACLDLKLRALFAQLEQRLCHRTSPWRRGFAMQGRAHHVAAYWACRGIRRTLGRDIPKDVEDMLALYCDNLCPQSDVRLDHRALSAMNNISFHWHRRFHQGTGGPGDAIRVALRILRSSGAKVLSTTALVRSGKGKAVSSDGDDLSDRICEDGDLLTVALRMLLDAQSCIQAHPARFGMQTQEAIEEEARFKSELRQREALEERMRDMGMEAMDDQRM